MIKYNFIEPEPCETKRPYIMLRKNRIYVSAGLSKILCNMSNFDDKMIINYDTKNKALKLIQGEGYKFNCNGTINFLKDKMPDGKYYLIDKIELICKLK